MKHPLKMHRSCRLKKPKSFLRVLDISSRDDALGLMVSLTLHSGQPGTNHTVVSRCRHQWVCDSRVDSEHTHTCLITAKQTYKNVRA